MLTRSIYFLFQDVKAVHHIIEELERKLGLNEYQMRAVVAEGNGLGELQGATAYRQTRAAALFERILWHLSITIFPIALIAFALTLLTASTGWSVFFALLAVWAQLSGYLFVNRLPNAQLDRFRTGLEQGNIVLQVNVPLKDIELVRSFVANRYPESRTNISHWHIGAFGLLV